MSQPTFFIERERDSNDIRKIVYTVHLHCNFSAIHKLDPYLLYMNRKSMQNQIINKDDFKERVNFLDCITDSLND